MTGALKALGQIVVAVASLAIAGCASEPQALDLSKLGGQQRWTAADMVDVAISDTDRNRKDDHFNFLGKMPGPIATGPVWAAMFVGSRDKSPTFTIVSARIQEEMLAAGFAARYHYIVDGTLSFEGREYPIHAEGARATGGITLAAMNEAVQLGVMDAAGKVRFIISGGLKH